MEATKKIEKGTILCGKFGYEAELFDFYEVMDVKNQKNGTFAVLKELKKERRYEPGPDGCIYYDTPEYVKPILGVYETERHYNPKTDQMEDTEMPAFKRMIKVSEYSGEYCEIDTYKRARIWDGKEKFTYNYH
jgi:hypothetical protein